MAQKASRRRFAKEALLMYIEFRLPSGAGGMAAGYTRFGILKKIKELAEQYEFKWDSYTKAHSLMIEFDKPETLTLFGIIWNKEKHPFREYVVKDGSISSQKN